MKRVRIILLLAGLLCCAEIFAQDKSVGLFNSPKGFGFSYSAYVQDGGFNSFHLYADMTGVLSGDYDKPGIRIDYNKGIVLKTVSSESFDFRLYAGPGVSTGFVRDNDSPNYGFLLALNGTFGARFIFPRGIALDLGLSADLGLHIRGAENGQTTNLKLYRNGLNRILFPQVKIEYCF